MLTITAHRGRIPAEPVIEQLVLPGGERHVRVREGDPEAVHTIRLAYADADDLVTTIMAINVLEAACPVRSTSAAQTSSLGFASIWPPTPCSPT